MCKPVNIQIKQYLLTAFLAISDVYKFLDEEDTVDTDEFENILAPMTPIETTEYVENLKNSVVILGLTIQSYEQKIRELIRASKPFIDFIGPQPKRDDELVQKALEQSAKLYEILDDIMDNDKEIYQTILDAISMLGQYT